MTIFLSKRMNFPLNPKKPTSIRTALSVLAVGLLGLVALGPMGASPSDKLDSNYIKVPMDNEKIQTYRGVVGRWIDTGSHNVRVMARRMGASMKEVRRINDRDIEKSHVFIPMSKDYYQELIENGYGRKIITLDKRRFLWPVEDTNPSSAFGYRWNTLHTGLDMACGANTVVVASSEGVVTKSGWGGGLGYVIVIRHADGFETAYAHNNTLLVEDGERVSRGQIVALSGRTGRTTGHHVHFEVRFGGIALNPADFLQINDFDPGLTLLEGQKDVVLDASAIFYSETNALN